MAIFVPSGPRTWSCSENKEGERNYRVIYRVEVTSPLIGPAQVRRATGLPRPGDVWSFPGGELDFWAWCTPEREVQPIQKQEGSPVQFYDVTCNFSTKKPKRCQDEKIENPLLELPLISGGSVRYTEEAVNDRFGRPIRNSAHEVLKGKTIEFDANRPTVKIKYNVGSFNVVASAYVMIDHLNMLTQWGLPPRTIKLSGVDFEKKYYGLCFPYYELSLEFDIGNAQRGGRAGATTFDRQIADEGTKVLFSNYNPATGLWDTATVNGVPADPTNPQHFQQAQDPQGNSMKVILDGNGKRFIPDGGLINQVCGSCNYVQRFFTVTGMIDNLDDPVLPILLTKTSGCNWAGTYVNSVGVTYGMDLTYNVANSRWQLTADTAPDGLWTQTNALFDCVGDNDLVNQGVGPDSGPITLYMFPALANTPGSIFVQKYNEANFFILGIPAIL